MHSEQGRGGARSNLAIRLVRVLKTPPLHNIMGIFRAMGFIIIVLAFKILLPEIFHAGEGLVLNFINFSDQSITLMSNVAHSLK